MLYAVLVLGISLNRTAAWAESQASQSKSDRCGDYSMGKQSAYGPHYGHKRIPQGSFVVESPLIASGFILKSNERVIVSAQSRLFSAYASNIPSRAPPSLS